MTQLDADLVFDRASMQIRNGQAQIGDVHLDQLQADIADLENARLLVEGACAWAGGRDAALRRSHAGRRLDRSCAAARHAVR